MADNATETSDVKSMDDIMALCKRRGFIYQASEIYGGINGFWDYGPLGAQLKKNLRDAWWNDVVMMGCGGKPGPDGKPVRIVPVDTCIIQNPKVWEASGHVGGFNDPMVDDKETKQRFRADHLALLVIVEERERDDELFFEGLAQSKLPSDECIEASFVGDPWEIARDAFDAKKLGRFKVTQDTDIRMAMKGGIHLKRTVLGLLDKKDKPYRGYLIPCTEGLYRQYLAEIPSPFSGKRGTLTAPRAFNLMFKTVLGATGDAEIDKAYLRPETAQGIFINFKNVVDTTRVGVPFGIAQTGKAFRNEVTPRNFTFRSREFEQMEIEFFCHPDEAKAWYEFWRDWRMAWWESMGLKGENLILREHDRDELAHYAKEGAGTSDIEYRFPFTAPGYGELEGIADRTNFDLKQHQEHSKKKMEYHDTTRGELLPNGQPKGEWYLPHVIEPSAGLDRGVLAVLCEAYTPDPDRPSGVVMKLHPRLSPIKAAVFPLVKKDGMPEVAEKLRAELHQRFGRLGAIEFDEKQSIGKRYARMDEAGCPFCFTVDGDTMTDQTVTVRDRDTLSQERIGLDKVGDFLAAKLGV